MNKSSLLRAFILLTLAEGVSYIILLGIAMPLKYVWDYPLAVRYAGMLHGLLFTLYVFGAYYVGMYLKWTWKFILYIMGMAILPWGPFVVHRKLRDLAS
jgi:integral membrane protein